MDVFGHIREFVRAVRAWRQAAADRAPDWDTEVIGELALPFLLSPEIRAAVRQAGATPQEILQDVEPSLGRLHRTEVLSYSMRLDARRWLADLADAAAEVEPAPAATRTAAVLAAAFAGVSLAGLALTPAAALLPLAAAAAAVPLVRLMGHPSHVRPVFSPASERHLRDTVIAPGVRRAVNDRLRALDREQPFHVTRAPALTEPTEPQQIVSTDAVRRLTRLADTLAYGSIGISGPRGVGKSTLLKGFCDVRFARGDAPDLRVLVSAPVRYDAREFLAHAFAQLCEAVIAASHSHPGLSRAAVLLRAVAAALVAAAGVALWRASGLSVAPATLVWLEHVAVNFALAMAAGTAALAAVSRLLTERHAGLLSGERAPAAHLRRAATALAAAGLPVAAGFFVWRVVEVVQRAPRARPDYAVLWTPFTPGLLILAGAAAALFLAHRLAGRARRGSGRRPDIAETAREHLRRLRFMQTVTTGLTGGLAATRFLQLGTSRNSELAEQQTGLPQVVADFRAFAAEAARWWRRTHNGEGRIVIGIDECDKISGGDAAQQFMNDVKAVFGVPHCLFLVSVSEEALEVFENRAFGVRDAFDTAFDDILRVEHLTFAEVREILVRRVAGIPDSLVALCHVLSGGLPRECLRTARALVEIRAAHEADAAGPGPETGEFATALVAAEVDAAKRELLRRLRAEGGPVSGHGDVPAALVEDLLGRAWPEATAEGLRAGADACAPVPAAREFAARLWFLAAVLEAFVEGRSRLAAGLRDSPEETAARLALLARVRQSGTGDDRFVRAQVDLFRAAWHRAPAAG
ncbi:hypothetical protein LG943_26905 [Streptomonospora sp. S1-112]|uniref:KAP NTPase domain-containing protein n=1 Tax=Streptomonospora mangrovi TaxID=2883123 RepID=A0A9X3NQY6_9ACTN|nr:hypothetical protein [Streptomonospora mangrovi]MDA0567923.1 hypothetical protein [Streptomonospora mangrovi]